MSDDQYEGEGESGYEPFELPDASPSPIAPSAPPDLAYCARWRAPLTAFGVIEVTLRMIQSRPVPFVLLSLFAAVWSVSCDVGGEAIFGPPDPSWPLILRDMFALNTLPHRLFMPLVDGLVISFAASLYHGPDRPLRATLRLLWSVFPVFVLACMLERLIDDVAMALLIVPMLFVAGRIGFASAQVMFERIPVLTSFKVSWQRTCPIRWVVFRLNLALLLCILGLEFALALATAPLGEDALEAVHTYVTSFLYAPLMVLFSTSFCWLYFEHQMGWLNPDNRPGS